MKYTNYNFTSCLWLWSFVPWTKGHAQIEHV
jgi:hypothetical protein